jgi:L-aspartate oxidase
MARRCRPGTRARSHDADEQVVIAHNWDELRLLMWNYVGIVRTTQAAWSARCTASTCCARRSTTTTPTSASHRDLLELRNLVDVCRAHRALGAHAATESRGLHFSRDFPADAARLSFPTVLTRPARSADHRAQTSALN